MKKKIEGVCKVPFSHCPIFKTESNIIWVVTLWKVTKGEVFYNVPKSSQAKVNKNERNIFKYSEKHE